MLIEEATREDIDQVAFVMEDHMKQREWDHQSGMHIDVHSLKAFVRHHIMDDGGKVYINKDDSGQINGFFIGAVMPLILDIRHNAAHEKMSGGEGLEEMWEKFIIWAKNNKASTAVFGCYDKLETPRFRRI